MGKLKRTKLGPKSKQLDETYLVKMLANEQLSTSTDASSQAKSPKYNLATIFNNGVESDARDDDEFQRESESEKNSDDEPLVLQDDEDDLLEDEDDLQKEDIDGFVEDIEKKESKTANKPQKTNLTKVMKAKGKTRKNAQPKESLLASKQNSQKLVRKKQLMLSIILDGLTTCDSRKGVSVPALKKYVLENSATNDTWEKMRNRVKNALEKGLEENLIKRPKGSENKTGLSGNFKINKNIEASQKPGNGTKSNDNKISTKAASRTVPQAKPKTAVAQKTKGATKSAKADKKESKPQMKTARVDSKNKGDKSSKKQTKHRRSLSNTEVATRKRPGPKGTMKKSKSLEQLAPRSKKAKKT